MNLLIKILKGKCPNCEVQNIFSIKGNLLFLKSPRMTDRCEKCSYKLNMETGFFTGAMYVCYGLAVFELVVFFLIFFLIFNLSLLYSYLGLVACIILTSTVNFRLSRIIWIYFFYKK
jgi:uncharacterized protein (DUF983 family)